MSTDLDGDMAPLAIQDVNRVVVHVGHWLFVLQVMISPNLIHGGAGAADQDEKHPLGDLGLGQVLSGKVMLALPDPAVDDGNTVGFGIAADATTETTRHPHQVGGCYPAYCPTRSASATRCGTPPAY